MAAPGACTAALAGSGAGNVDDGNHYYKVTFVTTEGETNGGTASAVLTVADKTTNGQVSLTAVPVCDDSGEDYTCSARNIYRTKAGASVYYYVGQIADNTTTTFTDNIADSSLTPELNDWNTTWPIRLDGSVGVGTGEIRVSTTNVENNATVTIQSSLITIPES